MGKWAVALATGSVLGVVLSVVGFTIGVMESAPTFSDNWLLTGWAVAVLGSGAASVVVGALAILRRHDRSWMVLLAACVGLFVAAVMLNEVAQGLGLLTG
jgi:hypothetical protein